MVVPKYSPGQTVYYIRSNNWVEKATILRYGAGFYTIKTEGGSGIRLRENRLYSSEAAANMVVERLKKNRM